MPLHGSKPSQATPTPRSPRRQCRSRCVAGSGSHSRSHLVAAGALRNLGAAAVLMLLETMHLRALELAFWQGRPNLWSGPGARLPVKLWGRRDTWCPNNGSSTPQHQASRPTTAGALTSSSTAPHPWPLGGALCCDETFVSPLTRDDEAHPGAAAQDGAVLRTAYRRKQATYPELATGGAQELCVLGCEVGGRWSADAVKLVQPL